MEEFSQQLRRLIDSRHIAIYALAAQSGVDRTLIHKIIKGQRVPTDPSVVQKLSAALLLTSEEGEALFESYKAAKMGEDIYVRRKFVLDFYNHFDPAPEYAVRAENRHLTGAALTGDDVVYGKLEVSNVLEAVLELEAAKPEGHIRILAQPECPLLFDFLALIGMRKNELVIDHVLCLENSMKDRSSLYNLNCIRTVMPVLASNCQYQLLCHYDNIASHFSNTSVLPYLILTEDYVVRLAADASSAAVSNSAQFRELYGHIFQSIMEKSHPLVTVFHSVFEEIEHINRINSDYDYLIHDFTSDPCLLPFADEEMMFRYVNPLLLKDETTRQMIQGYIKFSNLKSRFETMGNIYFSEEGLDRFLTTGRMSELPVEYYSPLAIPDRYRLLRTMYEASLVKKYHPVLVNAKKMRIPLNMATYLMKLGAVNFVYTAPNQTYTSLVVTEPSIVTAIQDFLDYLPETDLVCSPQETLHYLEEKLKDAPD